MQCNEILLVIGYSWLIIVGLIQIAYAVWKKQRGRLRVTLWTTVGWLFVLLGQLLMARLFDYSQSAQIVIGCLLSLCGLGAIFYAVKLSRNRNSTA